MATSSDASVVTWSDAEAQQVIGAHASVAGPILPTLQALQGHFGYVDPRAVPMVAETLNVSRAEVHGVLTFYHDLRTSPPAEVTVRLCTAEACQARGSRDLVSAVEQRLGCRVGERTTDGRVDLEQVFCLGNCAIGPAALIDGKVHGRLDADAVQALVDRSLEGLTS